MSIAIGQILPALIPLLGNLLGNHQQPQIPQQMPYSMQPQMMVPPVNPNNPYPAFFAAMANIVNPNVSLPNQLPDVPQSTVGGLKLPPMGVDNLSQIMDTLDKRMEARFNKFVEDFNNRIG